MTFCMWLYRWAVFRHRKLLNSTVLACIASQRCLTRCRPWIFIIMGFYMYGICLIEWFWEEVSWNLVYIVSKKRFPLLTLIVFKGRFFFLAFKGSLQKKFLDNCPSREKSPCPHEREDEEWWKKNEKIKKFKFQNRKKRIKIVIWIIKQKNRMKMIHWKSE